MASFFGEVVTLTSRAVDDDEEEEEDEMQSRFPEPTCTLQWQPDFKKEIDESAGKKFSCKTLILAIGPAATGFLEAYILWNATDIVATIYCDLNRSEVRSDSAASHCTCSVYRLKQHPDVLVCQCKHEMNPEISHVWTDQLFSDLDPTFLEVIVMDTTPTAEYRTHMSLSEIPAPFLRSLQSKKPCQKKQSCPLLESPNVIKGLSAAVLSHCQVFGISCVVYNGFLDSLFLHTDDIKVFLPVLSSDPIKNICQENPEAESVLRKLVERRALQGSLYT